MPPLSLTHSISIGATGKEKKGKITDSELPLSSSLFVSLHLVCCASRAAATEERWGEHQLEAEQRLCDGADGAAPFKGWLTPRQRQQWASSGQSSTQQVISAYTHRHMRAHTRFGKVF